MHLTSTDTDVPPSSEGHHYDGEIENGYWVDAANLQPGYRLLNADETFAEVTRVRIADAPLKAYNISVEDFETFFVSAEPGDEPVWVHNNCDGEFSIIDWSGYPVGLPRPTGPIRLISGGEYKNAVRAKQAANARIRREQGLRGDPREVHELKPVKFGGSPTSPDNKVIIGPELHKRASAFWSKFKSDIGG